jgi:tRNA (guanine37-N1)-methyltransferase
VHIDVVTIFPRMVEAALQEGVLGRAIQRGVVGVTVHDLRSYTDDRHHVVDDVPYGGGPGMVLKAEPLFRAVEAIHAQRGQPSEVLLTTPQGRPFTHAEAERLSRLSHVVILCGRYEGVDERVRERLATLEVSIGDYVLTGGELPALVIIDAVARLVPGTVGDAESVAHDSFVRGLLDCPHYTRPATFRDMDVPAVLTSGDHGGIDRWRRQQAVRRTFERRPDLLAKAALDPQERDILRELLRGSEEGVRS